jgi:tetratricopeptide (TPR) repeat protein
VGERAGEMWTLYATGHCQARLGNYDLARGYAQEALRTATIADDPTSLALAWSVLGLVHSRTGEHEQAIRCYRQALLLGSRWKTPMARRYLADMLAGFGDAEMAAGDVSAARQAWRQALEILDALRLPDKYGIRASLEQVAATGAHA